VANREQSVAISMPGVEANTSKVEGLSPKNAAKGMAGGTSFLDVLMDAGDGGPADAAGLSIEKSLTPKMPTKLTRRSTAKASPALPRNTSSAIPAHRAARSEHAIKASAQTKNENGSIAAVKDTPVEIPAPLASPVSLHFSFTPLPVAATLTGTAANSLSDVKENSAIPTVHSSPLRSTEARDPKEIKMTAAVQTASPAVKAGDFAIPTTRIALSTYLGTTTGTAAFAMLDEPGEPSTPEQAENKKLLPAVDGSPATDEPARTGVVDGDVTKSVTIAPGMASPALASPTLAPSMSVVDVQSPLPGQSQQVISKTAKAGAKAASVHQVPAEVPHVSQVQNEFRQRTTVQFDATHVPQRSSAPKEEGKADERRAAPANPTAVISSKGTQQSSSNAGQREKREFEAAAQAVSPKAYPESKMMTEANAASTISRIGGPDPRNSFSQAIASQPTTGTMKLENSVLDVPGNSSQAHGGTATQLRNAQDIGAEQSIAGATGAVHSAKLMNQSGQTELRVGFKAGEFGNVDIRTSMVRSQVTAQISVEHGELRNLLATELPNLQEKLSENPFTPANVVLSNYAGGSSSGARNGYQQNTQQPQNSILRENGTPPSAPTLSDQNVPSAQLDIHM